MKYFTLIVPLIVGIAILLVSNSLANAAVVNAAAQLVLFILVVCLPLLKTGRMSYVDIGWPSGIFIIGLVALTMIEGNWIRTSAIGFVYLFIGGRMALMGLSLFGRGHLSTELPRYKYQQRRWEKTGKTNTMLAAQVEVLAQGAFNAGFLAIPAFVIAFNQTETISVIEVLGVFIWLAAYVFETIADLQKRSFIRRTPEAERHIAVCNVGLWAYSRHPNYFGQWMGWNGVLIAMIPSWLALYNSEHLLVWLAIAGGALMVSYFMYNTLVYYSGAMPAEYYSVQKRPAYRAYQETTNQFFPGPRQNTAKPEAAARPN